MLQGWEFGAIVQMTGQHEIHYVVRTDIVIVNGPGSVPPRMKYRLDRKGIIVVTNPTKYFHGLVVTALRFCFGNVNDTVVFGRKPRSEN